MKKTEEEYLQLEPASDEMTEQFIVDLETDSNNNSNNTKSNSNGEISRVDPLDS
jgi:hypothetical protein